MRGLLIPGSLSRVRAYRRRAHKSVVKKGLAALCTSAASRVVAHHHYSIYVVARVDESKIS